MKKIGLKIAVAVFAVILIATLMIGTLYYKSLRDHIFPSYPENVTMQASANKTELRVSYRWEGFKEFSTYTDYIIIHYNYNNIEFNYEGINGSKEFYKSVRYLQGDFSILLPENSEKELVIPIDRNSKEGEIIIPIKSRDAEIENITIYYAHEVMLPMDMPTGWVSQKIHITMFLI